MTRLTRQEQIVLCVMIVLLLIGLGVKAYRTAHPRMQAGNIEIPK